MSFSKAYFVLGILVAAIPFSGLPRSGETALLVIVGLTLVIMSVIDVLRRPRQVVIESTETFVENVEI